MSLLTRIQTVISDHGFIFGDECWPWPKCRDKDGYGQLRDDDGKVIRAHQASHLIFKGQYKGMVVMHSCDNPPCFNPRHLSLGTYSANLKDCWDKRRRQRVKNT